MMLKIKKREPRKAAPPEIIADMYGLSVGTLANLRSQGRGPKWHRVGRRCIYRLEDVESWLYASPQQTSDSIRGVK